MACHFSSDLCTLKTNIYFPFFISLSFVILVQNFSTGTREATSLTYILWNIQPYDEKDENGNPQVKLLPSLKYDDGVWRPIPGNPYIYADGTTTAPESLPPVNQKMNYIGDPGRYAAFSLMGLVMLASFISILWMIWFWKVRRLNE